jgi:hypothetical protein
MSKIKPSEKFFTEHELSHFLMDLDIEAFKTYIQAYCSYKGLVTQIVPPEQTDEFIFLLKEQDKEVEKILIKILTGFFESLPKIMSIPKNPTFEESLPVFDNSKYRKNIQDLIMVTRNQNSDNESYSSRAFTSFEGLLLALERGDILKLSSNTLDARLIGSDSWVADIIYLYRGNTDLTQSISIDGVIKLVENKYSPKAGNRISIALDSNPQIEGEVAFLRHDLTNIEYLYLKTECKNEANSHGINTSPYAFEPRKKLSIGTVPNGDSAVDPSKENHTATNTAQTKDSAVHPSKKDHVDTIISLCVSILGERLTGDKSTDAYLVIKKSPKGNIIFPIEQGTLANYLSKKNMQKKLGTTSRNPFNTTIKALCLIVIKGDANTPKEDILAKLKEKGVSIPVSDSLILSYLEGSHDMNPIHAK